MEVERKERGIGDVVMSTIGNQNTAG
jgi:hypothetical protein